MAEIRRCGRCSRPAASPRGVPRCESCRLKCAKCDEPKVRHSSYCQKHRAQVGKSRPRLRKNCLGCGAEYRSKAASNYCPRCTHQRAKHPCPGCGTPIDKRASHCMRCWGAAHAGEDSPSWRGGRHEMTVHGYVLRRVPGHPRATGGGYVREHVLVMEEALGRYLLPGENVHHKNGQRADNRVENLELWTQSQPAGQRVEDLLAWAREIIARYA